MLSALIRQQVLATSEDAAAQFAAGYVNQYLAHGELTNFPLDDRVPREFWTGWY